MKSKESLFKEIMALSIHKVKERSVAGARDEFEQRMKNLPTKIHELNADPYMFIFDALIEFPEQVDFTLTQYQTMIEESFLNAHKNSSMLARHFRKNIDNHSFRIIQILMDIRDPNLDYLSLFFQIHNSVAMPENVLQNFRFTGYKWLARAYNFRQYPRPPYIDQLTSGILKSENRNLPTIEDEHRSREKYILKMLNHMTLTIENNLKPETQKVQSKYGFCFMCLNPAQYYCKDTKIPVCSPLCKKAHLNYTTNNPAIDFQYNEGFREEVEKMLISNLKNKKNVALSIDYLCSIYMNSQHVPKEPLPHKELLNSPVIVERVWVLYTMYYFRSNQVFEHIFADGLKNKIDYICINAAKYFLMIAETQHIFEVYQFLDCYGSRRILPTIINNLHDEENKIKFIYSLINRVFQSESLKNVGKLAKELQAESALASTLLRAINHDKNPADKFREVYGEGTLREMARFIIKNEEQISKARICDLILPKLKADKNGEKSEDKKADGALCHIFLEELLLEGAQINSSPFMDEMVRQVFYFLNTKVSDSIYSLLQVLYNVLDLSKVKYTRYSTWRQLSVEHVFSSENTSSKDTIFQFAYFIIMIVTELNQYHLSPANAKKDKRILTLQQFLDRFKHFDAKFVNNMKEYMTQVYNRLVEFPFSVESRGVLCSYPSIRKENKKGITFHPVRMLLDNWELIYESLSKSKNDSNILYRCCKCLIDFPTICQPFFQLLLSKLVIEIPQSQLAASSHNIQKQENLLLYINNIMQEEPNCIGTAAWKYLFLKDPSPITSAHKFLFEVGTLIHYSKMLTFGNFIWFVREFCRNVKLSQNYQECLGLLSYNFRLSSNTSSFPEQRERIAIVNKQYLDLFQKQTSVYHKIELIKDSFRINNLQFAIKLLDIIEINIISERLIILAIIDVLQVSWEQIENYVDKNRHRPKEQPNQHTPNTIWQHILQKVLTICLNAPDLLEHVSNFLLSEPKLHPYFQLLNIQHAIESAGSGRQFRIDSNLTQQLHKFEQHIPQMYNAKFCLIQRGEGEGLLEQFVCRENMDCIVRHFKYFWEIEQVYTLLTQIVVEDIISAGKNQNERSSRYDYDGLLKVLQQNDYVNLIKLENRLEPMVGYIVAVVALLQGGPQTDTSRNYNKELKIIVEEVIVDKASVLVKNQQSRNEQGLGKQEHIITFTYFMHVYSLMFAYLHPLFTLSTTMGNLIDARYCIDKIAGLAAAINSDYSCRSLVHQNYLATFSNEDGFRLPPGLLEQEHMANVLNILYSLAITTKESSANQQLGLCNWGALLEYLNCNLSLFKKLYQVAFAQIPNSKPKSNNKSEQKTRPKAADGQSTAQSEKESEEATQQLLLNQQIRYFKKTLQIISKKLDLGADTSKNNCGVIHQISGVLVQLLEYGFDFYDPVSQKLQFTGKDKFNYAYRIYESINRVGSPHVRT